jgi:hypothetical protein
MHVLVQLYTAYLCLYFETEVNAVREKIRI